MLFRCQHGNNKNNIIFHILIYLFDVFKILFETVDQFHNRLDNQQIGIPVVKIIPKLAQTYALPAVVVTILATKV